MVSENGNIWLKICKIAVVPSVFLFFFRQTANERRRPWKQLYCMNRDLVNTLTTLQEYFFAPASHGKCSFPDNLRIP